jgi:pimeloyl-ACP methyl ester carboxylesterase
MPTIRLGDDGSHQPEDREPGKTARLRSRTVELGGIETRAVSTEGEGAPALLLHGWLDNADTWLAVLDRLSVAGHPAIAYDLPGFGSAPPLDAGSVLDQLVDFAADAVVHAAESSGRDVVVAGNSLGGWVALRLAAQADLPLAGIVPIGPAGIRMAPLFFTLDRVPAVSRIIGVPAPVPPAVVRSVAGRLYRTLAFADPAAVDRAVVDRFTRYHTDRPVIRERIEYAKRLRPDLDEPFEADRIDVPAIVIWGDADRLCMPAGAWELAELLPEARIEMLPGVGHTPQIEAPEVVVAAIAELATAADGTG